MSETLRSEWTCPDCGAGVKERHQRTSHEDGTLFKCSDCAVKAGWIIMGVSPAVYLMDERDRFKQALIDILKLDVFLPKEVTDIIAKALNRLKEEDIHADQGTR